MEVLQETLELSRIDVIPLILNCWNANLAARHENNKIDMGRFATQLGVWVYYQRYFFSFGCCFEREREWEDCDTS